MAKLNKKGFTLVELLAVIVVLAILMIIAIPNVLKYMNDARKSSFKIYAQKALGAAQSQYQTNLLLGTKGTTVTASGEKVERAYCYTLVDVGLTSSGSYKGYIIVTEDINMNPTFYISLTDNSFSIKNLKYGELENWAKYGDPSTSMDSCPTTVAEPLS